MAVSAADDCVDSLSPLRPGLIYGVPPAESPRRVPIAYGFARQ